MTAPEPNDAGHLLPLEVWQAVVAGAEARAAELAAPLAEPAPGRLTLPDRTIPARSHGGKMPGGPRLGVIHSAETPLAVGYAYSIAANWFATKATTSATVMIDPAETIRLLPDDTVSYAVGPRANGFTVNVEQAGRASMTRAEWLSPSVGIPQMRNVAEYMRECRDRWGLPLRWATDAEIRRASTDTNFRAGWCQHDDIRRVLGATDHTDPGVNYPGTELMQLANTGGKDIMATLDADDLRNIANAVWHGTPGATLVHNYRLDRGEWPATILGALEARLRDEVLPVALAGVKGSDPQAIAAALVDPLARRLADELPDGAVDQGQLEAALRNVFGSLA